MTGSRLSMLAAAAAAVLLALLIVEHRSGAGLQAENAALRAQAEELENLRRENERLAGSQADRDELERLRREHTELIRLRGEVAALRRQSAAAGAPPAQPSAAPEPAPAPPPAPVFRTLTASLQSRLESGQSLVTGGWTTAPGQRTFLIVSPQLGTGAEAGQIAIETKLFTAPENQLASLGLDRFSGQDEETSVNKALGETELRDLLTAIQQKPGLNVIAAPGITTLTGRQAEINVSQGNESAGPNTAPSGPVINLLPRIGPDGKTIDMQVVARLNVADSGERAQTP